MASLTSQLIVSLIDKISGPAKGAAAALKGLTAAEKKLQSGSRNFKWGEDFQRQVEKVKLSSAQVAKLAADYEKMQRMMRGKQAAPALDAMKNWHQSTLAGLRAVGREQEAMIARQARLNSGFRGGARMALGALGLGGAGYAAQRTGRNAVRASASSAREDARDYLAGLTPDQTARLSKSAMGSSAKYNSVDATTMHERLRDTSMSMRSVDKAVELSDTIAQGTVVLQSLKGKDKAIEEGRKFFAALDVLGKNVEVSEVKGLWKGYIKALGVEGADMDLGGALQMARQSRSAGGSLSNRFMMTTGVALQRDMGDAQVGTALASSLAQTIGGRATKKTKDEQIRLGLRDKKGNFLNADKSMQDPDLYAWENLKPALQKSGVDVKNDTAVATAISKIYSNQKVADVFTKLVQQEEPYRAKGGGNVGGYNRTPDPEDAAAKLPKMDPFVAAEGLLAQLRNLAAQAPLMDAAAAGLTKLSGAIGSFVKDFSEDSTAGKIGKTAGVGILGAGAVAGGVMAAKGAYQWFTGSGALLGSAAALDASAAALTAAAMKLGGGSLVADAAKTAAATAGGAAAGAGGAAGGAAAAAAGGAAAGSSPLWLRSLIASPAVIAATTAAAAPFILRLATAEDHGTTSGERLNKYRGGTMAEARRRAFNADRERLGIPLASGTDGDVFSKGTKGIEHLDQSGPAAAAGASTGGAYVSAVSAALAPVDALIQAKVQQWIGMLNFNASPTITPKIGDVGTPGKGAALDGAASKHAAFSDYGFDTA